eukprot:gnl/MRDRNA2_/MRDRNA2_166412_c0_seq1.p1 gnl/MRDRNA2_/MRDRNA2_166412_c0~~gnl/MRDRNA2_/MRDRNA2_166412_c0_seq1.p1  ORF type:complete len:377 (+),score=81.70 gnl/MRDRNA2_/MRDRNA2_166412_c0_seq1:82-1131(+)
MTTEWNEEDIHVQWKTGMMADFVKEQTESRFFATLRQCQADAAEYAAALAESQALLTLSSHENKQWLASLNAGLLKMNDEALKAKHPKREEQSFVTFAHEKQQQDACWLHLVVQRLFFEWDDYQLVENIVGLLQALDVQMQEHSDVLRDLHALQEQKLGSSLLSDFEWLGSTINEMLSESTSGPTVEEVLAAVENSQQSLEEKQVNYVKKGLDVLLKFKVALDKSVKDVNAVLCGSSIVAPGGCSSPFGKAQLRDHFTTFTNVTEVQIERVEQQIGGDHHFPSAEFLALHRQVSQSFCVWVLPFFHQQARNHQCGEMMSDKIDDICSREIPLIQHLNTDVDSGLNNNGP